jgi:hypothetical protein
LVATEKSLIFIEKSSKHDILTKGENTMNADRIAKNARLVWNILKNAASRMTFIDMIVQTKLHATDLAYAIGWLAREDRIGMVEENGKQYFMAY